jgi:GntR family transcriptional regulator
MLVDTRQTVKVSGKMCQQVTKARSVVIVGPKWNAIADQLRSEVLAGKIADLIPSEAELMEKFDVSRTTVRKALTQLVNEGLIDSSQGTRRQIRRQRRLLWPMHSWENKHEAEADAWAVSVRDQGGSPSAEVSVTVEQASEQVATALGIEAGAAVVVRRRVRQVDGAAHQLADSYFPYELVKDHPVFLAPGDQAAKGGLLAAAGLPQIKFHDVIESRMPTPDETRQLQLPAGTPILIHRRTGYAKKDRAVRYMVTRMGANNVEISYDLSA